MHGLLTIAHLTWLETRRRRIVLAAVLGGLAFLAVYATAAYFLYHSLNPSEVTALLQLRIQLTMLANGGLYVVNFLTIAVAILLAVDTLSGEIGSGVMQTLASKPVSRATILLGKWLTYFLMTAAYLLLMAGGIVLIVRLLTGFSPPSIEIALPLMLLGATVMLTFTMAGGTMLVTITNGIAAFAFYGVAFIGGWIEHIGAFTGHDASRHIGTAISLVSPSDSMWRRAAYEMQPSVMRDFQMGPFGSGSAPTDAMVVWTLGFVLVLLAFAFWQFRRRAL